MYTCVDVFIVCFGTYKHGRGPYSHQQLKCITIIGYIATSEIDWMR